MKIILSPAKEMALIAPLEREWQLSDEGQEVVKVLENLTVTELQRVTKVNDKQLESVLAYRKSWEIPMTYQALTLYNGLAFRTLKKVEGWQRHSAYAAAHIRILSALYGLVSPDDAIKPYRLDVTMPLHVQGKPLKSYWKERLATAFEEGELVFNLASDEFSSLLHRERYEWVDVHFYEKKEGQLKQHATISKKGRGMMAGWLMSHEVSSVEAAKCFSLEGYRYEEALSRERVLVFVREA